MTILVVGGGFAGLAATWALLERGREVLLVWEGEGASALYPGALDRSDWLGPPDPRPLSSEVEGFLSALGAWAPAGAVPARVATAAGILRPARCRDRALFDLETARGRRVDVADFGRPGWDAAGLARAWSASAWARSTRTEFRPLAVSPPDAEKLRWLGDADLAACADDPAWVALLGAALKGASDAETPLLVGPWLGTQPGSVDRIREIVPRPLGEVLSEPGGAAGMRFEAARNAWIARVGVRALRGVVQGLRRGAHGFELSGAFEPEAAATLVEARFSEVVLATGGLIGGGIRFLSGVGPKGRSFSLSVDAALELRLGGREIALQSEIGGTDLQRLGLDALSDVGVLVDEQQTARAPDLFAAGDLVADRPRTALEAIYAGIGAARGVCRQRASNRP